MAILENVKNLIKNTDKVNGVSEVDKSITGEEYISLGENRFALDSCLTSKEYGIVENIYDTIAKDISILEFRHMQETDNFDYSDNLNYILGKRPNKLQTPSGFLYTLVYNTMKYGNGIAIPKYGTEYEEEEVTINGITYMIKNQPTNNLESIENLDVSKLEFGFGYREIDGRIYMMWRKKKLTSGLSTTRPLNDDNDTDELFIYPYDEIIHLRRKDNNVFIGDYYNKFNTSVEELVDKNLSSILSQISTSGTINGILQVKAGMISDEKKRIRLKSFMQQLQEQTGVVLVDGNEDFKELNRSFSTINTEDIDYSIDLVYRLFGVNKKIIEGTYTNAEYQAYYSKTLEPLINRLQQELEYKLLDKEDVINGHSIIVTRNFFIGANIQELSNFIDKTSYHGVYSANDIRIRIGESPRAGGDEYFTNANAVNVADATNEPLKGGD